MQDYEARFYEYQTVARGRLTPDELVREFDKSSRWYERRLRDVLPADRSAPILDCPCGYGNILYFLRGAGYTQVTGIDLDSNQVALARSLDLEAEVGDALEHLDRHAGRYQAIFSVDFLEHLDRNAALVFLDRALAGLRPGGVFVVRTPCCDGPFGAAHRYNDITHQWGMTSTVARNLFEMCGFRGVRILDENPQFIRPRFRSLRRIIAFKIASAFARRVSRALTNTAPKIWTRSMWVIGERPRLDA